MTAEKLPQQSIKSLLAKMKLTPAEDAEVKRGLQSMIDNMRKDNSTY